MSGEPWQAHAVCSTSSAELFRVFEKGEIGPHAFNPERHPRIRQALALCAGCPVRAACLQAGVEGRESGVWGGQYLSQRQGLKKKAAAA